MVRANMQRKALDPVAQFGKTAVVQSRTDIFDDFHVHGASAPEWEQRYLQLSPGVMHSSLLEARDGSTHVFRKWMSERVAQQGCVPRGKICFALLNGTSHAGLPRVQGYEFSSDNLFIVRGGKEFSIQRPRSMELLAVTFDADEFLEIADARGRPVAKRLADGAPVLHADAQAIGRLRGLLLDAVHREFDVRAIHDALADVLVQSNAARRTKAGATAAFVVSESQRIVLDRAHSPPGIEALCDELGASRRTVQNSFRNVTASTPVEYLRSVRLNAVRQRLVATRQRDLSVAQAATDQGFGHLTHFAQRYRALFGELPSRTARAKN